MRPGATTPVPEIQLHSKVSLSCVIHTVASSRLFSGMILILFPLVLSLCGVCTTYSVIAGWKGALQSTIGRVARTSGGLSIALTSNQSNGGFINMKQTRDRPAPFHFQDETNGSPFKQLGAVLLVLIPDVISG